MLLRFLCHAHRTLVEQSHSRALSVWDLSQQKALLFQQRGEPERAVAAAGELTRRLLCGCIAKLQPQVVSGAHQGTALACCQRLVEASTPSESIDAHEPVPTRAGAGDRLLH